MDFPPVAQGDGGACLLGGAPSPAAQPGGCADHRCPFGYLGSDSIPRLCAHNPCIRVRGDPTLNPTPGRQGRRRLLGGGSWERTVQESAEEELLDQRREEGHHHYEREPAPTRG